MPKFHHWPLASWMQPASRFLDHSEIYSGVYGRASITFYAFNTKTSRGIACGLQNIQKIRDGEPLGGHSRAEDDFATVEDEEFSELR